MEDRELIKKLSAREEGSLEKFIEAYGKLCCGVIASVLMPNGMESEVDRCFNDVLLIVWYKGDQIVERKGKFKNFLISLCKYKAIDILRERKPLKDINDLEIRDKEEVELKIVNDEEKTYLYKAIQNLKSPDREIFTMKYIDDLEIEEISHRLGIEKGTIYTRISRGKSKIKKLMEEYYE